MITQELPFLASSNNSYPCYTDSMASRKCSDGHREVIYWSDDCPVCIALDGVVEIMNALAYDPKKPRPPKRKIKGKLIMFPKPNNKTGRGVA